MDQSPAEKVLSVMPQGRAMELLNICALSGFSQDFTLKILQSQEAMGKVRRIHVAINTILIVPASNARLYLLSG
jgi:hypothetical protein